MLVLVLITYTGMETQIQILCLCEDPGEQMDLSVVMM